MLLNPEKYTEGACVRKTHPVNSWLLSKSSGDGLGLSRLIYVDAAAEVHRAVDSPISSVLTKSR